MCAIICSEKSRFLKKHFFFVDLPRQRGFWLRSRQLCKSIGFWNVPQPRVRTPWQPGGGENISLRNSGLNPGFELVEPRFNLEFEIYVQTLGSGTLCSNPGGSMFEPGVWRTPCSNSGFGTPPPSPREFEPWVRELHVRTRGLGNSMLEPGSGSPPPPGEFEPWVRELYVRTPLGNSMLEPRGLELLPPQGVRTLGSGTPCPSNFKELSRGHAPASFGEGGL